LATTATKSLIVASVLALMSPLPTQAQPIRVYTRDADFDRGDLKGVNHDAPGNDQLQISFNKPSAVAPYLWVANYAQDTVTKIDTRTGRQVAIYDSVLTHNPDGSIPPVPAPRSGCNSPSRTTVDAAGNAFVANRGFCPDGAVTLPSVTKFGGPGECKDRNGNGTIETSKDVQPDGIIDLNNPAEYLGQADECILWTRTYAAPGDHGRSVAVDAEQNLWLGGYASSKLYQLSNETGALLQTLSPQDETGLSFLRIYGIAIGPGGIIYTSDVDYGALQRIDPKAPVGTRVQVLYAPVPTYGLAVDTHGIVWLGNWSTWRNGGLVRADFNAGTVDVMSIPSPVDCAGGTRGVAVDGTGDIWAACWLTNRLVHFNSAGTFLGSYPTAAGTLGVAIDNDGKVWTANQSSNTVTRVDRGGSIQSYPAGGHPYSYWDMTGFQHRHFTMREGEWTVLQDSGTLGKSWGSFHWNHEPQGSTPAGTSIRMYARAADEPTALASQTFVEVTNNTPFSGVNGRHLEVKALLRTQNLLPPESPVLSDLTVLPRMCWKDVTPYLPVDTVDKPEDANPRNSKLGILAHEAVLLKTGEVLTVGGWNENTTRLFDPNTNTWSIAAHVETATTTRRNHTATLLPRSGYVLVAGGTNGQAEVTAKLYDRANNRWLGTGRMNQPRVHHTATFLPKTGHVLVVGGDASGAVGTAELYDPDSGVWTPTSSPNKGRRKFHTATLLSDGRVLVTGGWGADYSFLTTAEVYDPDTRTWTLVGPMTTARYEHTATLLPDERVLVVGGNINDKVLGATAEIYNPGTKAWTRTGSMKHARSRHAAVLLNQGMVLVTGGYHTFEGFKPVELYNPITGTWIVTCNMNYPRELHTMTLLGDGGVLVISGDSPNNRTVPLDQRDQGSAERLSL
jgi:streptogramin lyase